MRVTKWGEYGILCCLYLAKRSGEEAIGGTEIAEAQCIPFQYAQQILHRLRKGGVITSVRGPLGGYLLARDPAKINLREILNAAEGQTFEIICEESPLYAECETQSCGLRDVWTDLRRSIDAVLESYTLQSLLERNELTATRALVRAPRATVRPPDGAVVETGK